VVLPKIYTNCCDFVGDGSIEYSKNGINNLMIDKVAWFARNHLNSDSETIQLKR
jgi:hypothetical protein